MDPDFAGDTARLYARYRRDLPTDQAHALAAGLGLSADDVLVDLGCGTGQLTAPLREHCGQVVAVDPEAGMLTGLRERGLSGVLCVLGADTDLPLLGRLLAAGRGSATGTDVGADVGAVVVGNALHWMDEPAALAAAAALLRPGGGIAVVTQGPPLWLGPAGWQQRLRGVLEQRFGPVTSSCGSDDAAVRSRAGELDRLGLNVQVRTWTARHPVDSDWVIGHLGSALPAGALRFGSADGPAAALRAELDRDPGEALVEEVVTTAVIARRPG